MTIEQMITAAAAIFGSGSALAILARGLIAWVSGAAGREREKNRDLLSQRNDAWERVEYERRRADDAEAECKAANVVKRRALELASAYRGRLLEHNIDPGPWPDELT